MKKSLLLLLLTVIFIGCSSDDSGNSNTDDNSFNPPSWILGKWTTDVSSVPRIANRNLSSSSELGFEFKADDLCYITSGVTTCFKTMLGTTNGAITEEKSDTHYKVSITIHATTYNYHFVKISDTEIQEIISDPNGYVTLYSQDHQGSDVVTCFEKVFAGQHHFIAIAKDGTLWAWGNNAYGEVGDGSTTDRKSPVQISSETGWTNIYPGQTHNLAIKENGTLWAWGRNNYGKLGLGTEGGTILIPTQVGSDTDWKEATSGDRGSVAIKNNGTLYTWGANINGYLGSGIVQQNHKNLVPTQMGTETDWKSVSGKRWHVIAIKNNGTLWSWGRNYAGQLGIGTAGTDKHKYSPVQVGTATDWKWVGTSHEFSYALKENNTLWSWGSSNGLLINKTVPTQMGADNDWKTVSIYTSDNNGNNYDSALALLTKQDGTFWAFGGDRYERLGNGSEHGRYQVPTQIGTDANWESIVVNLYESNGIKSDGTFWVWGRNYMFENENVDYISSPKRYNCK